MSKNGEIVDVSARNKPDELSLSEYEPYITRYDVTFTTPDNTTYEYRMKKSDYKNLLSYFGDENGEDIIGKNVPLKKFNYGWEIDIPPYYKRGNKLLYNIRRFSLIKIFIHITKI